MNESNESINEDYFKHCYGKPKTQHTSICFYYGNNRVTRADSTVII